MPVYVVCLPAASDAKLVERTAPVGLDKPRNRPGIMPQVMTLIDETSTPGQRADLTYAQGMIPMLVEQRGTYDTGYWTLYWTTDRGGWAARTSRPCIVDRPGAQYALFKRVDTSRCEHPNLWTTEHSSTYRTSECPDCGFRSSHDSGD
jgi:hypothetical protein